MLGVELHNDPVFAQLLLNEQDLLGPIDDKVAAGVQWTFIHHIHISGCGVCEDAIGAPQHDRESPNDHPLPHDPVFAT